MIEHSIACTVRENRRVPNRAVPNNDAWRLLRTAALLDPGLTPGTADGRSREGRQSRYRPSDRGHRPEPDRIPRQLLRRTGLPRLPRQAAGPRAVQSPWHYPAPLPEDVDEAGLANWAEISSVQASTAAQSRKSPKRPPVSRNKIRSGAGIWTAW